MMQSTVDQFLKRLDQSGIFSPDELTRLYAPGETEEAPKSGEELAFALVKQKRLTAYQAGVLCEGDSGHLALGHYIVMDKIGEGGMGVVYKARDQSTDSVVALKVLHPRQINDPHAVERFRREVRSASKLKHPNIVAAIDSGQAGNEHFLIMEFVDGHTLHDLVEKKGPLPILTAVDAILDAAHALKYAHDQGVIHRDIKPSNLLMDREGHVKLLDLGLARSLHNELAGTVSEELTATGAVLGTIDYMAPEQALNSKRADQRSDIYSLGCTLFFLLSGRAVYGGETTMERLIAHREADIPSLVALRDHVPAKLDRIFQRMLAKAPENRFQSLADTIRNLDNCRDEFGYSWMMRRLIDRNRERWESF